jgi:hypothetical protein
MEKKERPYSRCRPAGRDANAAARLPRMPALTAMGFACSAKRKRDYKVTTEMRGPVNPRAIKLGVKYFHNLDSVLWSVKVTSVEEDCGVWMWNGELEDGGVCWGLVSELQEKL